MPVRVKTLGAGGLGENDPHRLNEVALTVDSAKRWLKTADYSFKNDDLLRRFLTSSDSCYSFLEQSRFFSDLCNSTCGQTTSYYDPYSSSDNDYLPNQTASLQFLLRNLESGVPLAIASNSVTPEDLFAVSAIWRAEVALAESGGNLFVFSSGTTGAVRVPAGYTFLAHTHPTQSTDKNQVEGDITCVGVGKAETVFTQDLVIYYILDKIINEVANGRIKPLADMCITRTTRLTSALFATLYEQCAKIERERETAEKQRDEVERQAYLASSAGRSQAASDNLFLDFL